MESQALQAPALRVGEATTTDEVFKRIVEGLAAQDALALARVWLIQPGDICEACRLREECPDQTRCLHLVARWQRGGLVASQWCISTDTFVSAQSGRIGAGLRY